MITLKHWPEKAYALSWDCAYKLGMFPIINFQFRKGLNKDKKLVIMLRSISG